MVVATLGDSITAGSPGYDPIPANRERYGFGDDERSQFQHWAERAGPELELRNCGAFGERTDEIGARLEPCAEGADAVVIQGGINDIAQGVPVARIAAELEAIVRDARQLGLEPYLADLLPWNNGHPQADRPIAALNRRIEQIGRDQGVSVLGFHDALEDPNAPGLMQAGLSADGDHPSLEGYRLLGELVARRLQPLARRSSAGGSPESP